MPQAEDQFWPSLILKKFSPTMTMGGDTSVRMSRKRTKPPTMMPRRLIKSMSVILTALADLTRKITDILT